MIKILSAIICLMFPITLMAQEYEFEYRKNKKLIYLEGDAGNYEYNVQQPTPYGTQITKIQSADGSFRVVTAKNESETVKKVINSEDSVLATYYVSGERAKTLLLSDGRTLQYKKINSIKWMWLDNRKEAVTYKATQAKNRRRVIITYHDPAYQIDAVQLLCLDQGRTKLKSNPAVTTIIVSCVVTTLFAIARSQEESTYP